MSRIPIALPFAALVAVLALAACGGSGSNTSTSVATAKPTATPKPFVEVTVTGRALVRSVPDSSACLDRALAVKVAAFGSDEPVSLAEKMFGAMGGHCVREVRPGDSDYASAVPFGIYVPHVRVGSASVKTDVVGKMMPASSIAACIAAGKRAGVAVAGVSTVQDEGFFSRRVVMCTKRVASDDSAADSATTYHLRIPSREIPR